MDHQQALKQFYEILEKSQYWPRGKLVAWQRRLLVPLLNQARTTSSFYQSRLNVLFRRDGSIDWDEWTKVPIVTREEVTAQFDAIASRAPIGDHGPFSDVYSSGSTGHPVSVRTTRLLIDMSVACNWRGNVWADMDWSKTFLATLSTKPNRRFGDNLGPWGPSWVPASHQGRMIYSDFDTPDAQRIDFMKKYGADYIISTPNAVVVLADLARKEALDLKLDKVLLRGGAKTQFVENEMREVFGAQTSELYSSKEAGSIAHPCPHEDVLHVNDEAVVVEIVDSNGHPVAAGEMGRVIVTPLASTAFPLIRYDQGDMAIAGDSCSCGRTLMTIKKISGRVRHEFFRPNGEMIGLLSLGARKKLGAGQWQIAKVGPDDFEVRYVRKDWGEPVEPDVFVKMFKETYYGDARVRLVPLDKVPLSSGGKFLEKVVEWDGGSDLRPPGTA